MRDVELAEYLLQLVQVTWCCVSDACPTVSQWVVPRSSDWAAAAAGVEPINNCGMARGCRRSSTSCTTTRRSRASCCGARCARPSRSATRSSGCSAPRCTTRTRASGTGCSSFFLLLTRSFPFVRSISVFRSFSFLLFLSRCVLFLSRSFRSSRKQQQQQQPPQPQQQQQQQPQHDHPT